MDNGQPLKLHRFQYYCAVQAAIKKGLAIFARPGLGKTIIALKVIQIVQPKRVLVVAPIHIIENTWPDEIKKWNDFSGLTYTILRKEHKPDLSALIHAINPESLQHIAPGAYDMIITDESSLFKNPRSKRFRLLARIARRAKYRIVLTGTPKPKSYLDIFTQIYLADLGETLGHKYTRFRSQYFNTISQRYGTDRVFSTYELKKGADRLIQKRIAPRAISLDTKGLIEMPELNMRDILVSMDKEQQDNYDMMEKELWLSIKGHKVFSLGAGSAYWKCHQLANGAVYSDDTLKANRPFIVLHDHKINALRALVDEMRGAPLLVGYQYEHDRARILQAFPNAEAFSKENLSRWNASQIPIMLLQYQSGAYGLNLQYGGRDIALFSLTDNWANYDQLICRIYRQGASSNVFVHRIITKGTVDQVIAQRLDRKQSGNAGLIEALNAYKWIKKETSKTFRKG